MSNEQISINRAPVFTLWGAVVAERLGYEPGEALSLAKVMAGLTAQKKGRMLGIYKQPETGPDGRPPAKAGLGEDCWISLCDRPVPAIHTEEGLRGVVKDKPVEPDKVAKYLRSKFGDDYDAARDAMQFLASSYAPDDLAACAWDLYAQFRPVIPRGTAGWGAKGILDLAFVRSLA